MGIDILERRQGSRLRTIYLLLATVAVALGCLTIPTGTAHAIVDGSVVPGGWYGDARPASNEFAFVGHWNLDSGGACTASLVAPEFVLTAGHCAGAATVRFNMLNIDREWNSPIVQSRRVVEQKWQSDIPGGMTLGNTLLARLDRPVFGIAPVRMPDAKLDKALWEKGNRLNVYGWGSVVGAINPKKSIPSKELRFAVEKVVDNEQVLNPFTTGYMKLSSVSGYFAHGDSGGPIVGRNSRGNLVQVGIVEGSFRKGSQHANRIWPQKKLIEFINARQYVATPGS